MKYEPAILTVNFSNIDKAIERLNREEVEVEVALNTANT